MVASFLTGTAGRLPLHWSALILVLMPENGSCHLFRPLILVLMPENGSCHLFRPTFFAPATFFSLIVVLKTLEIEVEDVLLRLLGELEARLGLVGRLEAIGQSSHEVL